MNVDTRLVSQLSSAGLLPCRIVRYALWLAIPLLLAFGGSTNGHALAASEPGLEDQLLAIEKDKLTIRSRIDQIPSHVETEVDRIMDVMDELTAKEISRLVDDHYSEVDKSLQGVSLPEDIGALEVYWKTSNRVPGLTVPAWMPSFSIS